MSDVGAILKIQTYLTKLIHNLMLNELLNLSRKCAIVRDNAASIRIYNCNMVLSVKFARADRSFVDVCLPALESHSVPILSRFLHAQAATVGNEFTLHSFACVSVPISASSGNAAIAAPVSCVHLNQPSGSRCGDLTRVSNDAKSRELASASYGCGSTTAACSLRSNEPAPSPMPSFCFPLPPLFEFPPEPD